MQKQEQPETAPVVLVVGQGVMKDSQGGLPFLLVTSASEPGRVHVCRYAYEGIEVGSRMQCDCRAAHYGKACRHVLVARAWLAGSLSGAQEATRLAQTARAERTERPKQPKRADVVEPILRHPRDNKPFSLLKS